MQEESTQCSPSNGLLEVVVHAVTKKVDEVVVIDREGAVASNVLKKPYRLSIPSRILSSGRDSGGSALTGTMLRQ